jgi:hypothetical protein
VYQLGRGSEPVIVVGSMMSLVARYIVAISQNAERDFRFLTGRWYSLPAQRKQQKVAAAAAARPPHALNRVGRSPRWATGDEQRRRRRSEDQAHQRFSSGASLCRAVRDRVQY